MMLLILAFGAAFAVSLVVTYLARGWAARVGIVDIPDNARRIHDRPIPRVGGIGVYVGVAAVIGFAVSAGGIILRWDSAGNDVPFGLVLGGAAMFLVGLWDDIRSLPARAKLAAQVLIASVVFLLGIRIESLTVLGGADLPTWLSYGATVFWIVGITNAFNLIDGSDGVAAGSAIFAALAMGAVFLMSGQFAGALVALTLAGATLGFLFFNFPPASIFLGDCGSLFIGFTLASLGVITSQKAPTVLAVAIPVVSFGLPILDTALAIVRRFLRGEPIFKPDRGHIHHRLRDLGHSPRAVALLLYAVSAGFALLSILLVRPTGSVLAVVFLVAGAVVWIGVQRLHLPELLEVQRIVHRSFLQRRAIAANVRIREAVGLLARARTAEAVCAALDHAFAGGEVAMVELWLPHRMAAAFARPVPSEGAGMVRVWSRAESTCRSGSELWEVRLPFRGKDGATLASLSLWYPVEGDHVFTDLTLVATSLQPVLHRALAAMERNEIPVGVRSRVAPVAAAGGAGVHDGAYRL